MDIIYTIAAAVVAFGVLVFLHELGHFLVACAAGRFGMSPVGEHDQIFVQNARNV